ncbi:MAG: aconitase X [Eubacteriaceae bacterium]
MLKLTDYEKEMLEGKHGKLKAQGIKKIVEYANVLGADELCEVTMAHVFCGNHDYLSAANEESVEKTIAQMQYCTDEIIPKDPFACYCQSDCGPMDPLQYDKMYVGEEAGKRNQAFLDYYQDQGVNLIGTCVPYMCGFIPLRGEHYVTSESHAVTLMNSLWSACGNSDGLEAGFWSAACGRTPKWGNHIMENRLGTHVYEIKCEIKSSQDWDLLGYTIGRKLPTHGIPVLDGLKNRPTIFNIKYFFAAMATTSGPEMCHLVGITPEAITLEMALGGKKPIDKISITKDDLIESLKILNGNGKLPSTKIDYISLGCPHYSIEELRYIANSLKGKKVNKEVALQIWTAAPIKETADRCGYTKIMEEAGAIVLTSSCPLTSGVMPPNTKTVAFDSAKQAHYIAPGGEVEVYYGSLEKCIASAVSGNWEVETWDE